MIYTQTRDLGAAKVCAVFQAESAATATVNHPTFFNSKHQQPDNHVQIINLNRRQLFTPPYHPSFFFQNLNQNNHQVT